MNTRRRVRTVPVGPTPAPSPNGSRPPLSLSAAARRLLDGLRARPDGQVSPSVYETGRVITLAPWLAGQPERVSWLLAQQHADGRWGGPGGYGLIPTLSATEALLTTALRIVDGRPSTVELGPITRAAGRGLSALRAWLRSADLDLPDLPAADLIAPALIEDINHRLIELADSPVPGLAVGTRPRRLPVPTGPADGRLARLRAALQAGHPVPEKVVHALEVLGDAAYRARGAAPVDGGTVGASPAATAAWLGPARPRPGPGRRHLEALVAQTGGPVPCGTPITAFERSWVLGDLGRARLLAPARPRDILSSLATALRPEGVPGGPGLPADADTTSATLYALALAGRPRPIDALWRFELPTHFCTWPGEDGASPTVNAHVLEALAVAEQTPRVRTAVRRVARWLVDRQNPDGSWSDRWHASPHYATWCCTLALRLVTAGPGRGAVHAATRWVLDSQRTDGSWGLWTGTAEETAYAIMVLAGSGASGLKGARDAVRRGAAYLNRRLESSSLDDDPPMWHDKDLYRPHAIIEAAVLAALRLAG